MAFFESFYCATQPEVYRLRMLTWKRPERRLATEENANTVIVTDPRMVMTPRQDQIYIARRRLEEVINPEYAGGRDSDHRKKADTYDVIGRGARCLVFRITNNIVAKVAHALSTDRERLERHHYQQNCDFFFGADAVVEEYFPPQHGEVQAVSFQKNMSTVLHDPRAVIFTSGYAEEREIDTNAYAKVSNEMMKPDGKFNEDEFRILYPHMGKFLDTLKADSAFRERFDQLLSQIIFLVQKTKKGFDFMANENIVLHPDADGNEWLVSILDPHLDLHAKLMPMGQETLQVFNHDSHHDVSYMYKAHLTNFLNLVRVINSLAAFLGYKEDERIHVNTETPDWERLFWMVHNFIKKVRNTQEEKTGDMGGSIMPTVVNMQKRLLEVHAAGMKL